jgi:hypothetical protein
LCDKYDGMTCLSYCNRRYFFDIVNFTIASYLVHEMPVIFGMIQYNLAFVRPT